MYKKKFLNFRDGRKNIISTLCWWKFKDCDTHWKRKYALHIFLPFSFLFALLYFFWSHLRRWKIILWKFSLNCHYSCKKIVRFSYFLMAFVWIWGLLLDITCRMHDSTVVFKIVLHEFMFIYERSHIKNQQLIILGNNYWFLKTL